MGQEYNEIKYWENRRQPNPDTVAPKEWIEYIKANVKDCYDVLEFGPGVGRIFPAYEGIEEVSLFDCHDRYLDELIRVSEAYETAFSFEFNQEQVGVTPYSDMQFDAAVSCQVFLHIRPDNIVKVMAELARVAEFVIVITYRSEKDVKLAPHVFNHDYLQICEDNNWGVTLDEQTDQHIKFTYWSEYI